MQKIIPVIIAGGFGTRLWPLSSNECPKQFNTNIFQPTLFQQTCELVNDEIFFPPVIIINKQHQHFIQNTEFCIIVEPCSRNTSPAILIATLIIQQKYGNNATILVLPCDHIIPEKEKFIESVRNGILHTDKNIILFGVKPQYAETGYGYISTTNEIQKNIFEISSFTEKPSKKHATEIFSQENYYWNCGIFLFQSHILIKSYQSVSLNLYNIAQTILKDITIHTSQQKEAIILPKSYSHIENISIDYNILEKIPNILLSKMLSNWCDVGSFELLHKFSIKDSNFNTLNGNINAIETKNCLIHNTQCHSITTVGIQNIAVINTQDGLLICDFIYSQKIKNLPQICKQNTNKVTRTWGTYEVINEEKCQKIKKIIVEPMQSLSLQKHKFRNENWFITQGTATVVKDNKEYQLQAGDSIFIPKNTKHRLINNTQNTLHIVEIQTGEYLGEDDITRYHE